jgi:hypothetical protein
MRHRRNLFKLSGKELSGKEDSLMSLEVVQVHHLLFFPALRRNILAILGF